MEDAMTSRFRIGLTADFLSEGAGLLEPILPAQFGPLPQVAYECMPAPQPTSTPEQLRDYDAVITVLLPRTHTLRSC